MNGCDNFKLPGCRIAVRVYCHYTDNTSSGHVLRRISVSIIRLFCNFRGNFDFYYFFILNLYPVPGVYRVQAGYELQVYRSGTGTELRVRVRAGIPALF